MPLKDSPDQQKNGESCIKTLDGFVAFNGGRCVFAFFTITNAIIYINLDHFMFLVVHGI